MVKVKVKIILSERAKILDSVSVLRHWTRKGTIFNYYPGQIFKNWNKFLFRIKTTREFTPILKVTTHYLVADLCDCTHFMIL